MNTKSRTFKLFAVAFVALFALVCFAGFAACGDDNEKAKGESCEHKNVTISEDESYDATCGQDGLTVGYCDDCGEKVETVIPATGKHTWDDGKVSKAASVDEEGETTYTCTVCGETKTATIPKVNPDDDDDDKTVLEESEGLEYKLNDNEDGYVVTGIGSCIDTKIVIPAEYNNLPVVAIGNSAFRECTSFTSVIIPLSVTSIGTEAFYNCTSLTGVIFEEGSKCTTIGGSAFSNCSALTSIIIPSSVTSIDSAFPSCVSLESVIFEENSKCEYIGISSFSHCTSLTSIIIPYGVTAIGEWTFFGCSSLTSVVIPNSVKSIAQWAFEDCISLTSIIIPDSVEEIGGSSFSGCGNLESMTLPFVGKYKNATESSEYTCFGYIFGSSNYDGGVYVRQEFRVTSTSWDMTIESMGFYIPGSLTEVTVTGGMLLRGAFYGCSFLTSVKLGESVENIGICVFFECTSLVDILLSENVTSIGNSAFYDCTSLTSVYYSGSPTQWSDLQINIGSSGNEYLTSATIYYYSEEEPDYMDGNNYWHCVDGEIVIWSKQIVIETNMTDADVEALVSAIENTLGYDGTYTLTSDVSMSLSSEMILKMKYIYSLDKENSIEYSYDERMYSFELDESGGYTYVSESYIPFGDMNGDYYTRYYITDGEKTRGSVTASNCFDSLYRSLNDYSYIDLSGFTGLASLTDLENALLKYAYDLGYSYASSPTEIKMTVAGGVYTLSAIYDTGEVTLVITVENGCITGMNLSVVETDDGTITAVYNGIEISYEYDSSLANNFSDLSQWS